MNAEGPARRLSDSILFSCVCLTVMLAAFAIIALTFLRPEKTFRSLARIKLDFHLVKSGYNAETFRAELPRITSNEVLSNVVKRLELTRTFQNRAGQPASLEEATDELRRMAVIRPIPNSALIEIQVLFSDPAKAADIANAIAEAYRQDLLARNIQTASNPLRELENRQAERSDVAHAARLVLKQMEITNAPPEQLDQQRNVVAEAERVRDEAASALEDATRNFAIPGNTLRAFIVDQAAPGIRPVQTHRSRVLTVGISGSIALGIAAGALAVIIRRSCGTGRPIRVSR